MFIDHNNNNNNSSYKQVVQKMLFSIWWWFDTMHHQLVNIMWFVKRCQKRSAKSFLFSSIIQLIQCWISFVSCHHHKFLFQHSLLLVLLFNKILFPQFFCSSNSLIHFLYTLTSVCTLNSLINWKKYYNKCFFQF